MNRIAIAYLIFSFLFNFGASSITVPSLVVRSPVHGNDFGVGEDIPYEVCPGPGITSIDSIALISNDRFHILEITILSITVQPANNQLLASSASFSVGSPGFGLILTLPGTNKNAHCGGKLRVKWKDPFKLYQGLTFLEFNLVEFVASVIQFSPPAVSVPVSAGERTVRIPRGLKNHHNYNVAVRVVRNGVTEQYYSDNFRISGCKN
ncbi:11827_t:CDS:2 [Paraglomus brasilianum]|uniref:11827_t:CDS:1 n=1 Tax=Paraglomus brasilianum TaxID=144538 RepID=A0A9N8Z911_9GLOM|nr:11827_t:CDS:2 [Paraglomus brasilianum]